MSEQLISKKELLEEMKISYGQLYRWKRKKLIPEEWFIKKSVSTGQETFFPREKIMERINRILELKDDVSLDELAEKFTYIVKDIKINRDYLIRNNIISKTIIERFEKIIDTEDLYDQRRIFTLFIYNKLINGGFLGLDEINEVTISVFNSYSNLNKENQVIIIKRKLGVFFYYVIEREEDILKDEASVELTRIRIKEVLEKITELKV